jgi:flavin-dependent dehydrogenase
VLHVDVTVAGGGPAGAAFALCAARRGLTVAVVEPRPTCSYKPGEYLSAAAVRSLDRLDLTRTVLAPGAAIRSRGVRTAWGSADPSFDDSLRQPLGAWLVDRSLFEAKLRSCALRAGVIWLASRTVGGVERGVDRWRIEAEAPGATAEIVTCGVVVDATGRRAAVARRLGARVRHFTQQLAQVWWLRAPTERTPPWLTVEAAADGWWYHAPGPGERQVVARISERRNLGESRLAPPPASLMAEAVGPAPTIFEHATCDTGAACLDQVCGEGWMALGDAACAFDPIASQGLANALSSADAAGAAVEAYLHGDRDALSVLGARITATFAHSLAQLPQHYALEARWPEQSFWRRNQNPTWAAPALPEARERQGG